MRASFPHPWERDDDGSGFADGADEACELGCLLGLKPIKPCKGHSLEFLELVWFKLEALQALQKLEDLKRCVDGANSLQ